MRRFILTTFGICGVILWAIGSLFWSMRVPLIIFLIAIIFISWTVDEDKKHPAPKPHCPPGYEYAYRDSLCIKNAVQPTWK